MAVDSGPKRRRRSRRLVFALVAVPALFGVGIGVAWAINNSSTNNQPKFVATASPTNSPTTTRSSGPSTTAATTTTARQTQSNNVDSSKDYGGGIKASTKCSEYLEHDWNERHDAAMRLSRDYKASSPGNPMWGLTLDSACGKSPGMTVGGFFGRSG